MGTDYDSGDKLINRIKVLVNKAKKALSLSEHKKALKMLRAAKKLNDKGPKNSRNKDVEFQIAETLMSMGFTERAVKAYLRSFRRDENFTAGIKAFDIRFPTLDSNAGMSEENRKNFSILQKIIKKLKESKSAKDGIADREQKLKQWQNEVASTEVENCVQNLDFNKALITINRGLRQNFNPELARRKTEVLEKMGEFKRSLANWNALLQKGIISEYEFEDEKNRIDALMKERKDVEIWRNLADEYETSGRTEEAEKYRQKVKRKSFKKRRKKSGGSSGNT
ncbi:hypothetical protein ACFL35_12280 [Candidatus Riflebacteria bacterium]